MQPTLPTVNVRMHDHMGGLTGLYRLLFRLFTMANPMMASEQPTHRHGQLHELDLRVVYNRWGFPRTCYGIVDYIPQCVVAVRIGLLPVSG